MNRNIYCIRQLCKAGIRWILNWKKWDLYLFWSIVRWFSLLLLSATNGAIITFSCMISSLPLHLLASLNSLFFLKIIEILIPCEIRWIWFDLCEYFRKWFWGIVKDCLLWWRSRWSWLRRIHRSVSPSWFYKRIIIAAVVAIIGTARKKETNVVLNLQCWCFLFASKRQRRLLLLLGITQKIKLLLMLLSLWMHF